MSASSTLWKAELTADNGLFTTLGIANAIGPGWGAISGSAMNMVGICWDVVEDAAKSGARINPRITWMRIVKVLGPFGGIPENKFVVLVSACAVVGVSAIGVFAVVAAGPAEIAVAALGLFFDALSFGAAQSGYDDDANARYSSQRRDQIIQFYVEQRYRRTIGSRKYPQ